MSTLYVQCFSYYCNKKGHEETTATFDDDQAEINIVLDRKQLVIYNE